MDTFQTIRDREDPNGMHHDLKLKCVKCGRTQTCRCSKPKRTFEGICDECSGMNKKASEAFEQGFIKAAMAYNNK